MSNECGKNVFYSRLMEITKTSDDSFVKSFESRGSFFEKSYRHFTRHIDAYIVYHDHHILYDTNLFVSVEKNAKLENVFDFDPPFCG